MQPYVNINTLRSAIQEILNNSFLLHILDKHCADEYIHISTFIDQDPVYKTREYSFIIHKSVIKETKEFYTILAKEIIKSIHPTEIPLDLGYNVTTEHLDKHVLLTIDNKFPY